MSGKSKIVWATSLTPIRAPGKVNAGKAKPKTTPTPIMTIPAVGYMTMVQRGALYNGPDTCKYNTGIADPELLSIDLRKAAQSKFRGLGSTDKTGHSLDTVIRDMCVQWNNAVAMAHDFTSWYSTNGNSAQVVLVDMNNVIHAIMAESSIGATYTDASKIVLNTFIKLAGLKPHINFILVGTSAASGLNYKLHNGNLVHLYIPCNDKIYGKSCRAVHGFSEVDDLFLVVVAIWFWSRSISVSIYSHDKYDWWDNVIVPRTGIDAFGNISHIEYRPSSMFSGLKGFMGYMDTTV